MAGQEIYSYFTDPKHKEYFINLIGVGEIQFAYVEDKGIQFTRHDPALKFEDMKKFLKDNEIPEVNIQNSGEPDFGTGEKPSSHGWGIVFTNSEELLFVLHAFAMNMEVNTKNDISNYRDIEKFVLEVCSTLYIDQKENFQELRTAQKDAIMLRELTIGYLEAGKKFGVFDKNPDRIELLKDLRNDIKQTLEKRPIDYKELAKKVNDTRLKVLKSHKDHSFFGKIGITDSRLERKLNAYLDELVKADKLSKKELLEIKNPQESKQSVKKDFGL